MTIDFPALPWPLDALEPHLSAETLHYHHGKHHRGYVEKLRKALEEAPPDAETLEDLLRTARGRTYDLAAQAWNHAFYWESMTPDGGGAPHGPLARAIDAAFGSLSAFQREFHQAAMDEFGSGWAWLCHDPTTNGLAITSTTDAQNPLTVGVTPLLTCDVWEHAYYIDYRNERAAYVAAFLEHLVDWDAVARRADAAARAR